MLVGHHFRNQELEEEEGVLGRQEHQEAVGDAEVVEQRRGENDDTDVGLERKTRELERKTKEKG